jgi:tRNA (adenine37-N6)-methyltransferase
MVLMQQLLLKQIKLKSSNFKFKTALSPIGHLITCYPEKFGVPRQPGLVPAAWAELVFTPAHRRAEAVRGLEGFSHVWLITQFHLIPEEAVQHVVRPPRLGGNERIGVFASRSPFRPNRLGLSLVKLEQVVLDEPQSPKLKLSGIDCVSGTPVYDIKPYLPYCESLPEARAGFAPTAPAPCAVHWQHEPAQLSPAERELVEQNLQQLPVPAYLTASDERVHHMKLDKWELRFQHTTSGVLILELHSSTA